MGVSLYHRHVTMQEASTITLACHSFGVGCEVFPSGWLMSVVEKACNNLQKKLEGADAEYFFPLVVTNPMDFKPVLINKVRSLVLAFGMLSGLFIVGVPAVGETPWCCGLAMLSGRMHVRVRGLRRKAGWRRGKQFDVFRQKPGELQEAILLDDPAFGAIPVDDLMSLGEYGYQGHSNARYTPPKWSKNRWRTIMSNAWDRDAEPAATDGSTISFEDFEKMLQPGWAYEGGLGNCTRQGP